MKLDFKTLFFLLLFFSCSNASIGRENLQVVIEINCFEKITFTANPLEFTATFACSQSGHRLDEGYDAEYKLNNNKLFTGVRIQTRDNRDYLFYGYENGHALEIIDHLLKMKNTANKRYDITEIFETRHFLYTQPGELNQLSTVQPRMHFNQQEKK